jgi:3D (Asp-Asp-Asp) domain-containing protein
MKKTFLRRGLYIISTILLVIIFIVMFDGVIVKSNGNLISPDSGTVEATPTPTPEILVFVEPTTKYVKANTSLNVRGKADGSAEIWDTIPYGTKVTASAEVLNGYCLIAYTKDSVDCSGYVYNELLTTEEITEEMIEKKKASSQHNIPVSSQDFSTSGEMTYLGNYYITGYDTCSSCCGKSDGITASGAYATVGRTVAMKGLPFGTVIYIEGIGYRVVEDRGVGSGKVDVLCGSHAECYAITGYYKVYIVK